MSRTDNIFVEGASVDAVRLFMRALSWLPDPVESEPLQDIYELDGAVFYVRASAFEDDGELRLSESTAAITVNPTGAASARRLYNDLERHTSWDLALVVDDLSRIDRQRRAEDRDERFVEDPTAVTIHQATFAELLEWYGEAELAEDYANGGLSEEQARAYEQHFNVDPEQGT